jgi:hypothetical protein
MSLSSVVFRRVAGIVSVIAVIEVVIVLGVEGLGLPVILVAVVVTVKQQGRVSLTA